MMMAENGLILDIVPKFNDPDAEYVRHSHATPS
jgi:hypothetical protein